MSFSQHSCLSLTLLFNFCGLFLILYSQCSLFIKCAWFNMQSLF
jgi:hypothetical protein